jgi:hypothetical protein
MRWQSPEPPRHYEFLHTTEMIAIRVLVGCAMLIVAVIVLLVVIFIAGSIQRESSATAAGHSNTTIRPDMLR